jgi:hypothetical protein
VSYVLADGFGQSGALMSEQEREFIIDAAVMISVRLYCGVFGRASHPRRLLALEFLGSMVEGPDRCRCAPKGETLRAVDSQLKERETPWAASCKAATSLGR